MDTTITAVKKKPGRPKKATKYPVETIRDLVLFLSENNVKRFKHENLEIEIDTIVNAASKEPSESLDQKAKHASSLFAESPEDEEKNLFWSSTPS